MNIYNFNTIKEKYSKFIIKKLYKKNKKYLFILLFYELIIYETFYMNLFFS